MIDYLSGIHLRTMPHGVILNVSGVGYSVETPLSTLAKLGRAGESLELYIHTLVREDSIRLFGFLTLEEKVVFSLLLSMSGVGPKVSMAMLSTLGVSGIYQAAFRENPEALIPVPGIGPRLAEKVIVELKAKLPKLKNPVPMAPTGFTLEAEERKGEPEGESEAFDDLRSALENLGFKGKMVTPLIAKLKKNGAAAHDDFQTLLKFALRELGGSQPASAGEPLQTLF